MPDRDGKRTIYDYPKIYTRLGMELGHFGCIMLDVEPIPVLEMLDKPSDWFYFSKNPKLRYVKGPVAATQAHATLLYGLTPDDKAGIKQKDSVDELLRSLDLSEVTIDHIDSFPAQMGEPYSCVVAKLNTDNDLGEANRRLRFLPHIDTFIEYVPHVTLAYVPEDKTEEAISTFKDTLEGLTIPAIGINYGGPIT
jgi:2'-5' RNA ligase